LCCITQGSQDLEPLSLPWKFANVQKPSPTALATYHVGCFGSNNDEAKYEELALKCFASK
jgi:hypothetical protein